MSDQFVGEIRIAGFNFAPQGWATCDGQILPISQNTALFSLLGVNYGGNGTSNFALPDFQGRAPMHWGTSTTGTVYDVGEVGGASTVTLSAQELPAHTHTLSASGNAATTSIPTNALLAVPQANPRFATLYHASDGNNTALGGQSVAAIGGNAPHNNLQPYLTLIFIIALQGIFPPRQ